MHEDRKAADLLGEATQKAAAAGKSKVTKIGIAVGTDSGYSGDSIRTQFEKLAKGTVCEGAGISVRTVKARLCCPNCGELFDRRRFHFECPKCGTQGEPSASGREVKMESIEME
jgi:hydrogenase nickel incorporation protein HypA/HybF